jgi:FMN-dependent NADH-azoreductase
MRTLLHIDSSPLGDNSISRQLSQQFVKQWKSVHPDGEVVTTDLTLIAIPPVTAQWVGAAYTPENSRSNEQREVLALSDKLIAQLHSADEYVFGVPMHNFGIPSSLKLWIDQVARAGKTFSYIDGRPAGLLKGKKATFLVASGGVYDVGSDMGALNFVEPYLRSVFGFLGVTDTTFITAGGAAVLNFGRMDRQTFLEPHFESIRLQLQPS